MNSKAEKPTHGMHSISGNYLARSANDGNMSAYFRGTSKHFEAALTYLRAFFCSTLTLTPSTHTINSSVKVKHIQLFNFHTGVEPEPQATIKGIGCTIEAKLQLSSRETQVDYTLLHSFFDNAIITFDTL